MQRTSLLIPPNLKKRAQKYADTLGLSLSELIRKYLEAVTLGVQKDDQERDPFMDDVRVFSEISKVSKKKNLPTDTALNHDDYLYGDDY